MNAKEIIEQIKRLPVAARAGVTKLVVEQDDSWEAEFFQEGMNATAEDRFVDTEKALFDTPPTHRR